MTSLPRAPHRFSLAAAHAAGRRGKVATVTLLVVLGLGVGVVADLTLALFTRSESTALTVGTQRIFSGERVTTAFSVTDVSGGSSVDRSNPVAFASDGRSTTTAGWSSSFSTSQYVEFDQNAPLPAGLALSSASFRLSWATAAGSTACYYFDVRRISTDSVLATYGSSGSPVACVTGTSMVTTTTSVPSVSTSDIANDVRIRVYGRDSSSASTTIDVATVIGDTSTVSFTLYPVRYVDAADASPATTLWGLNGT